MIESSPRMTAGATAPTAEPLDRPVDSLHAIVPRAEYSNHALPPADRFGHWQADMAGLFDAEPHLPPPADHLIEVSRWTLGGAVVTAGHYPALRIARGDKRVRLDPLDHYAVTLGPRSGQHVDADGRRIDTAPMQPLLIDLARPFGLHWEAGPRITLYVPRAALDELLPRAFDLHGVKLEGVGALLFAHHLLALEQHLPTMAMASVPGARHAALHLLAASLASSVESLGLARPVMDQSLCRLVRSYIESQLQDPELDSEALCRHFRISRSTLYRLFESEGGVAAYVRERRLARIHALLAQPGRRDYIGRIAEDFGFRSAAAFSRAFMTHFGYRPREVSLRAGLPCAPKEGRRAGAAGFRPLLDSLVAV